jgi:hypothetical protein
MMEIFEPIIPEKAEVISECYSQGEAYMAKHLKVSWVISRKKKFRQ